MTIKKCTITTAALQTWTRERSVDFKQPSTKRKKKEKNHNNKSYGYQYRTEDKKVNKIKPVRFFLLRKRWRHGGEGHQRLSHGRLGHLLLWVKGELWWGWRLDHGGLHEPRLVASKLLILEILSPKRSARVGLSVIVATATTTTK